MFLKPDLLDNFIESSKYWNGVDVADGPKLSTLCNLFKDDRFGPTGIIIIDTINSIQN